ncbi:uncharacterized protein LOC132732182 isoform X3 [Ruditapes philippinarum]|uniref:uncharacterized protein LOC132732182 isoform X3 n=1 Tax=Ruditapes philippinarum TaxID=129788 RepID=UPI00295B55E2|nr:uncharacterized protein LOC132732182 isoform X3 [Ruditapes philippinarum]
MQEDSDGRPGQGQQNQARNIQFLVLYDQNHPYTRRVRDSTPIQAGSVFGQAYFTDTENDGDSSMLYNNGIQPSQALHQPSSDVQRNFLPTQIENDTVVAQPSSDISRESPSFLGVDVRSGSRLPSTTPCQSASGLSTSSINRPPGGHLIVDNVQLQEPGVVVDLQRLRGMLKQRHGESKYQKDIQNCMRSFQQALFSEADASQYAIQLLYYLGESGLKCLDCKEIHNIGTVFRHKESCSVHICFQEILNAVGNQDTRQSNGAITNDRDQISDQRPSVPSPYSIGGDSITMESMLPLERMELGQQEERVARGINDGATGGVSQAGAEETLYKAAYLPPMNIGDIGIVGSYQTCNDSSSFTRGYATAPGPPPNQTAQNVHLPPAVSESSARFPMYQRHDRRLRTFNNWQHNHVQCPKALTDAGFFYREIDDECQCFECGQVLKEWSACDNPWSEHARHSPDCPFVKREKGQAFVNEVRKNTAKKEIRTPPTIFRTNTGRSEANPQRSYQAMIAEDNSLDCSLLEMGFTKEQIQVAINRFRKVNGSKEHTTEHLIEIIISDESQHGKDLSICGVCGIRKVRVSQSTCGHIVCIECAVHPGERCKFCDKPVVKRVLYEYDVNILKDKCD